MPFPSFHRLMNFTGTFQIRKSPLVAIGMRSRPEICCLKTVKSGATGPTIHDNTGSRPICMNIAKNSPVRRAASCLFQGSLSTRMEMATILSMPQHRLHRDEGAECDPRLRVGEQFVAFIPFKIPEKAGHRQNQKEGRRAGRPLHATGRLRHSAARRNPSACGLSLHCMFGSKAHRKSTYLQAHEAGRSGHRPS
jgi:hypothetical protein